MSSFATPPIPPHFHEHHRLSPTRSSRHPTMTRRCSVANADLVAASNSRKRKASPPIDDDEMSSSPAIQHARLPSQVMSTPRKRAKANLASRPLSIDRLLETLDKDSLRSVLRSLVGRNPGLREEVMQISPRPSIASTLQVLRQYHHRLMAAYPLDPNPRSDYSHDRVQSQRQALLDALTDFTPHFLPPNESQSSTSLSYLDGVTEIIHDLPEWDNPQHNLAKRDAYEEISRAWIEVIKEASKRGGGIQLQYGGWEQKLRRHDERSHHLMRNAYEELRNALGWLGTGADRSDPSSHHPQPSVRQELFSGTYGHEQPQMRTGMW